MKNSTRFLAPIFAIIVTVGTVTAVPQSKSKSSKSKSTAASKTTAKKATSKYHRLPSYYGQLKLKEDQIAEIYDIKESYGEKIDALLKELEELKEEQADEIKDVLTRTQVTALNKLIATGSSKTKAVSSSKSSSSRSKSSGKK